jgi:hypothetical protein
MHDDNDDNDNHGVPVGGIGSPWLALAVEHNRLLQSLEYAAHQVAMLRSGNQIANRELARLAGHLITTLNELERHSMCTTPQCVCGFGLQNTK